MLNNDYITVNWTAVTVCGRKRSVPLEDAESTITPFIDTCISRGVEYWRWVRTRLDSSLSTYSPIVEWLLCSLLVILIINPLVDSELRVYIHNTSGSRDSILLIIPLLIYTYIDRYITQVLGSSIPGRAYSLLFLIRPHLDLCLRPGICLRSSSLIYNKRLESSRRAKSQVLTLVCSQYLFTLFPSTFFVAPSHPRTSLLLTYHSREHFCRQPGTYCCARGTRLLYTGLVTEGDTTLPLLFLLFLFFFLLFFLFFFFFLSLSFKSVSLSSCQRQRVTEKQSTTRPPSSLTSNKGGELMREGARADTCGYRPTPVTQVYFPFLLQSPAKYIPSTLVLSISLSRSRSLCCST